MKAESAAHRIVRGAAGALDLAGSLANRLRIAIKDREDARSNARAREAGPTVRERQEELIGFYDRYENLVETLCDAAQLGATPKLQSAYSAQRDWIRTHYSDLRPFVSAYLRANEEDSDGDPFEALVGAETLEEFLAADDGHMISRITRTREALNLYGEHLRQLATRIA